MDIYYDIDPKLRFLVLRQDLDMKPTRISKITGIPLRTVQDWEYKVTHDTDILEHHVTNIVQHVTQETRTDIEEEVKNSPRHASSRRLGAKYNLSHTTVLDIIHEAGGRFKKPEQKHVLTSEEMENRVQYCVDMLKYKAKKIKRCFFSDEMGVRLSELHKCRKQWILPNMNHRGQRIEEDVKVNCWAAISWQGATSLYIFIENLNNPMYQDIVRMHKEEMTDLYDEELIYFQQDNHPVHNKIDVISQDENFQLINFPTYSPDLNPIENLWAALKYRVACDEPLTKDELIQSLLDNWREITQVEFLQPYLKTLEGRYRVCIEKKGERLPH